MSFISKVPSLLCLLFLKWWVQMNRWQQMNVCHCRWLRIRHLVFHSEPVSLNSIEFSGGRVSLVSIQAWELDGGERLNFTTRRHWELATGQTGRPESPYERYHWLLYVLYFLLVFSHNLIVSGTSWVPPHLSSVQLLQSQLVRESNCSRPAYLLRFCAKAFLTVWLGHLWETAYHLRMLRAASMGVGGGNLTPHGTILDC